MTAAQLYSRYLEEEIDELKTKIKNQAKSLTEMHGRIERDKRKIKFLKSATYGKTFIDVNSLHPSQVQLLNTDLIAERNLILKERNAARDENNSLRKELEDLRENFAYNENSWRESNTNLKEDLNTANDTIADYKEVIKQKSEALDRASELLRKVRVSLIVYDRMK